MSTQFVVVDNTDPSITYNPPGSWIPQTVNISQATDFLVPPLYGTFQECHFNNATMSFNFTGRSISAIFASTDASAINSCTLDGQPITIELLSPLIECGTSVPYGSHTLVIGAHQDGLNLPLPLVFDYISYDPSSDDTVLVTNLDAYYSSDDPSIRIEGTEGLLQSAGDFLDFTFVGYSLGIYGSFLNGSFSPAPASYSIDGNPPVNFTINVHATYLSLGINSVILLQTPRYSLSQHHFHLDYWGDANTNNSVPLELDFIVVQNMTTPHVLLDPFPATPFPAISSPSPSTTPTPSIVSTSSTISTAPTVSTVPSAGHGPIIGGTIAGATILVLIILAFFIYRRRHIRISSLFNGGGTGSSNEINPMVEPFWQQDSPIQTRSGENQGNEGQNDSVINIARSEDPDAEPNLLIEPFYHWRTHFRSSRKHRLLGRRSEPEHVPVNACNIEPHPATEIASQRPLQYRVYGDRSEPITQQDEGSIIVDLPPTYTTIGFTPSPASQ